jgi:diguanylate cyclase (GGDEF)-like protein
VTERRAIPGLVACAIGVACCLLALATGEAWLIAPAAASAVVAAVGIFGLTAGVRSAREHASVSKDIAQMAKAERDQMAARAARFEAEAVEARRAGATIGPGAMSAAPLSGTDAATVVRDEPAASDLIWPATAGGHSHMAPAGADGPPRPEPRPPDDALDLDKPGEPEEADEPLTMIDPVTGVYNERFFMATLDKRVSAARRGLRPLAVGIIDVVHRDEVNGHRQGDPKVIAACLLHTLRDADTTCRLDDGRFGIVLEDTPENGAVWTIERARRRVVDSLDDVTMWAGLACYPAHAFAAEDLLGQAQRALTAAHEWKQDRIEVAGLPED